MCTCCIHDATVTDLTAVLLTARGIPLSAAISLYFWWAWNLSTFLITFVLISTIDNCLISVEVAGPSRPVQSINIVPDQLRGMASWVLQQCVNNGRLAGFVTYRFSNMLNYISGLQTNLNIPFRTYISRNVRALSSFELASETYFITVSVTARFRGLPSPGDYDPSVPWVLGDQLQGRSVRVIGNPSLQQYYGAVSRVYYSLAMGMQGGGEKPWWSHPTLPPDEMTYSCDPKLGDPTPVDCSKLRYELGAGSDILQIEPDNIKFISSGE